jgi:hypothetical protein
VAVTGSIPESRGVSTLYAFDNWQLAPEFQVEYGVSLDRYTYLDRATVVSPRAAVRFAAARRTFVLASASHRVTAPGADQFLPLSPESLWLPPDRTFSALGRHGLEPETVRHYEVALEHELWRTGATVHLRRFSQSADNQLATVFGLNADNRAAHYHVGSAGSVLVEGWTAGVQGAGMKYLRAGATYTASVAEWSGGRWSVLGRAAPSVVRRGVERLHDVIGRVDLRVPQTSTAVNVVYRLSTGFSAASRLGRQPVAGGRFKMDVRQRLPYQPAVGGTFHVLLSFGTLVHDIDRPGSHYDELLTVAPPTRFTGGLQVWF